MSMRQVLAAIGGVAALAAPAAAFDHNVALASSRYTIGISGFVPVICRASVTATSVTPAAGTVQLGSLNEFCNSPRGYRVHADYSPSLAQAKILVDGVPVPLHKDGTSVISRSNRAAIANHTLALDLPKGVTGGSISIRIEPL